jgi:hypothetical protein
MQYRQEDGPFHIEGRLPAGKKTVEYPVNPCLLPEPLKDERRADLLCRCLHAVAFAGQDQEHFLGEAGKGANQTFRSPPLPVIDPTGPLWR